MEPRPEEDAMTQPEPTASPARRSFGERLIGALKLEGAVYDEVEHDTDALPQAGIVVVLAAIASGIGAATAASSPGLISGMVGSLAGWLVSAAFVWFVGVRWMEHTSDYGELLRTLGFASAPQLLLVLSGVPILGVFVGLTALIWGLAAYVVAVREALDVETGRAILVCVLAYLLKVASIFVLVALGAVLAGATGR
jgi:hypothetical protein